MGGFTTNCSDPSISPVFPDMEDDEDENILASIARIMNLGALLVKEERYAQGMEAIQQAIFRIQDLQQQQQGEGDEDMGQDSQLRVAPAFPADKMQHQTSFVCPFMVDTDPTSVRALIAVAFYNLAVVYQLTQDPESEADRLETCACYEYALGLMDDYPEMVDPEESFFYVYLAACDNLSGLYHHNHAAGMTWKEVMHHAFLAVPPHPSCPVYRHFERAAMTADVASTFF